MWIDPSGNQPASPARCGPPKQVIARLCPPILQQPATVHHLAHAESARVVPSPLAEQAITPPTCKPCEVGVLGKWPWQLPPTVDDVPAPTPKAWFVSYASPAEARTGNMLDLLA